MNDFNDAGWWRVVGVLAHIHRGGCDISQFEHDDLFEMMRDLEFSKSEIETALAWIDRMTCIGTMDDVLEMIDANDLPLRIDDPSEKHLLNDKIYEKLKSLRNRGVVGETVLEKTFESLRELDSVEWDAAESNQFMRDFLGQILPHASERFITEVMSTKAVEYVN